MSEIITVVSSIGLSTLAGAASGAAAGAAAGTAAANKIVPARGPQGPQGPQGPAGAGGSVEQKTVDPEPTDDTYEVGTIWIKSTPPFHDSYLCADNTTGNAVWLKINNVFKPEVGAMFLFADYTLTIDNQNETKEFLPSIPTTIVGQPPNYPAWQTEIDGITPVAAGKLTFRADNEGLTILNLSFAFRVRTTNSNTDPMLGLVKSDVVKIIMTINGLPINNDLFLGEGTINSTALVYTDFGVNVNSAYSGYLLSANDEIGIIIMNMTSDNDLIIERGSGFGGMSYISNFQ